MVGDVSLRSGGYVIGIVSLNPCGETLMVADGPNVGAMWSGQLAELVVTSNVIWPLVTGIGPDWPLACPGGLFPPWLVQKNGTVTVTVAVEPPSPDSFPAHSTAVPPFTFVQVVPWSLIFSSKAPYAALGTSTANAAVNTSNRFIEYSLLCAPQLGASRTRPDVFGVPAPLGQ